MPVKPKAALGFIFITLLIDVIGIGIIIPVIPTLIEDLIGAGLSQAAVYGGWLMATYSIMQFLFSPMIGNLSDQYGRRPVLLISLFGLGIDYLFMAWAPTMIWLFIGRIFSGIMGASFTTATAYIADISSPEKRAQNFGLIGAAFGLGFIIGPVIGGLLVDFGSRAPFIAAAILSLLNFLYGYFVLPESLARENRRKFEWKRASPTGALKQLRKYPLVSGLIVSFALIYIAGYSVQSTWNYFTMEVMDWTERQVGYSLGFVGLMVALVQGGLIRVINPKLGDKRSVYLGMTLWITGFVLFAVATEGWMMYVFLVPYCLGGIAGPALQGIISSQVPANEQGELQGALTSLISLTAIIGPLMMTHLFHLFTSEKAPFYFPGISFLAAAVIAVIGLILAMRTMAKFDHLKH